MLHFLSSHLKYKHLVCGFGLVRYWPSPYDSFPFYGKKFFACLFSGRASSVKFCGSFISFFGTLVVNFLFFIFFVRFVFDKFGISSLYFFSRMGGELNLNIYFLSILAKLGSFLSSFKFGNILFVNVFVFFMFLRFLFLYKRVMLVENKGFVSMLKLSKVYWKIKDCSLVSDSSGLLIASFMRRLCFSTNRFALRFRDRFSDIFLGYALFFVKGLALGWKLYYHLFFWFLQTCNYTFVDIDFGNLPMKVSYFFFCFFEFFFVLKKVFNYFIRKKKCKLVGVQKFVNVSLDLTVFLSESRFENGNNNKNYFLKSQLTVQSVVKLQDKPNFLVSGLAFYYDS